MKDYATIHYSLLRVLLTAPLEIPVIAGRYAIRVQAEGPRGVESDGGDPAGRSGRGYGGAGAVMA